MDLWAFEPSEEIRAQLERRMESVPKGYRVSIHAKAVSDEPGHAAFDATPGISGVTRTFAASVKTPPARLASMVPVATLR